MAAEPSRSRQARIGEDIIGDVMTKCIGDMGRWQIYIFVLTILPNFPLAYQELMIVFMSPHEDFYCVDETLDKCSADCPKRVFDTSQFKSTIASEWDLVCGRAWLASISQSLLMSGILTGHIIFGLLADAYGRRIPLIGAIVLESIAGVAIALVPEFWQFLLLRYITACACGGAEIGCFVMIVEIVGQPFRPYFAFVFQVPFYIGLTQLAGVAHFINEWHTLQLVMSLPTMLLIPAWYWLLPESPRWLLLTGRRTEAINLLEKAQKFNKGPYDHIADTVNTMMVQKKIEEHYFDLLKTKYVRMTTLNLYFQWGVLGFSYFGVMQMGGKFCGNIYLNNVFYGIVQISGAVLLVATVNRVGRKFSAMSFNFVGAITLLGIAIVPKESLWIVVLGCIGLFAISASFSVQYLWSGELFPTVVRNIGIGSAAVCAKVGSVLSPLIADLYKTRPVLTPAILGTAVFLAFVLCYCLPETLHAAMMDTVEEAEEFGKRIRNKT